MSNEEYAIDLEMMMDFIDESLESFAPIPSLFVSFESNPDDLQVVEAIFRPVHSLKGNAAYFGLMKIKNLAHDLESVLDLLRKSKLMPSRDIVDGLLAGIDQMQEILEATRQSGVETVNEGSYRTVHSLVRTLAEESGARHISPKTAAENQTDSWLEIWEGMVSLREMPALKQSEGELLDHLIELLENIAPIDMASAGTGVTSGIAKDGAVNNPLDTLIGVLQCPSEDLSQEEQGQQALSLLKQVEELCEVDEAKKAIVIAIEEFDLFVSKIGYDPMLQESLLETALKLEEMQVWQIVSEAAVAVEPEPPAPIVEETPETVQAPEPAGSPPKNEKAAPAKVEKEMGRTMRVSEDAIDDFLGYVGELIAIDEMFRYIHGEMVKYNQDLTTNSDLLRVINTFTKLSDDLQNSIMGIRRVSVKPMLHKTQRIVRDVATSTGKKIETLIVGDEVNIDRSLIETLEAPMVHMVRNAADHGIETPEERMAANKSEIGVIRVSMHETEELIILAIVDDGKGFDYDRIRAKALKMGIIRDGMALDEKQLANLVFSPGFSTAEVVTDVSGRGVGMDAVKRSVEEAGGSVEIMSETGKGSEFRIQLPKSIGTQIINSFVVQLAGDRFVLPMDKVSGSFKAEPQMIHRLPNGAVCVKRNEMILPVVCLDGPYTGSPEGLARGILITIETKPRFVFYVDTILGMQKVVVRNVPWVEMEKFHGAAVMGDGCVSMIVNVEALGIYAG